jgi:hypothetical protein
MAFDFLRHVLMRFPVVDFEDFTLEVRPVYGILVHFWCNFLTLIAQVSNFFANWPRGPRPSCALHIEVCKQLLVAWRHP